jgi:Histidine kinase-like ATPase domain
VHKWKPEVFRILFDLGFFDLLGLSNTPERNATADIKILPMRSGETHDPDEIGNLLDALASLFQELGLEESEANLHLYGVLSEAMENVVHHAYPEGVQYPFQHVGRWWMTGAVKRSERRLTASIFDQGVSIPGSLPRWRQYASFMSRVRQRVGFVPGPKDPSYDGQAIEAALTEAATSTDAKFRGKGLALMKGFIDDCQDGQLRIVSRNGEVVYRRGDQPIVKNHAISLGGTLIEWDVVV